MLKAIWDRIIVLPIEEAKETASGFIQSVVDNKPCMGEVISVGNGRTLENWSREILSVKEWDIVFFQRYAPDEFEYENKKYFSIKESSILGSESK